MRHEHAKLEHTALANTLRVNRNDTGCTLNDLLYYHQAESDSIVIELCCPLQLAKLVEQFRQIAFSDTYACVSDLSDQEFCVRVVRKQDIDHASLCELECVFDQVD